MNTELYHRLYGTREKLILQEFLSNTSHFTIANIFLEFLLEGKYYFLEADSYILISACFIQSYYLGISRYQGYTNSFLGNLIVPSLYTIVEVSQYGYFFFEKPNHIAIWFFAFGIGLLQSLRSQMPLFCERYLMILENVLRINIILVMYWIYGVLSSSERYEYADFFQEGSHIFLMLSMTLTGIMLGIAQYNEESFLRLLRTTSEQLRSYSEWLLGKNILAIAVADSSQLSLTRRERTILFMDIRGFTSWSETQTPEIVVDMINTYCATAEQIWIGSDVIKVKLTGDEIMMVFQTPAHALLVALRLQKNMQILLKKYDLGVGIGLHIGALVEGLLGSNHMKSYDVIGDTVNTAKRICERAKRDELLLSANVFNSLTVKPKIQSDYMINMKGKAEPLLVFSINFSENII